MTPGGAFGSEVQPSEAHVLIGWGFVLIVVAGVFIGTLTLRPKRPTREA